MAFEDLSVRILQQIGAVAVQHAWLAAGERGAMPVRHVEAMPARLHAVDRHALVIEEGMKEADSVGAAADAGDQRVGQPALALQHLLARLPADH